jgi:hypothetical protein
MPQTPQLFKNSHQNVRADIMHDVVPIRLMLDLKSGELIYIDLMDPVGIDGCLRALFG